MTRLMDTDKKTKVAARIKAVCQELGRKSSLRRVRAYTRAQLRLNTGHHMGDAMWHQRRWCCSLSLRFSESNSGPGTVKSCVQEDLALPKGGKVSRP